MITFCRSHSPVLVLCMKDSTTWCSPLTRIPIYTSKESLNAIISSWYLILTKFTCIYQVYRSNQSGEFWQSEEYVSKQLKNPCKESVDSFCIKLTEHKCVMRGLPSPSQYTSIWILCSVWMEKRLLSFMKKMTTFSLGGATQGSLSHLECNTSAEAHLWHSSSNLK